jgi:predicted GNAT family acetyltransferase
MGVEVTNDEGEEQFVVTVDGARAGLAAYRSRPGLRVFTHTEIDDAFEGQGLGSKLVSAALDATRAAGLAVEPSCPFVRVYIERHGEYLDLVPEGLRNRYGLGAA